MQLALAIGHPDGKSTFTWTFEFAYSAMLSDCGLETCSLCHHSNTYDAIWWLEWNTFSLLSRFSEMGNMWKIPWIELEFPAFMQQSVLTSAYPQFRCPENTQTVCIVCEWQEAKQQISYEPLLSTLVIKTTPRHHIMTPVWPLELWLPLACKLPTAIPPCWPETHTVTTSPCLGFCWVLPVLLIYQTLETVQDFAQKAEIYLAAISVLSMGHKKDQKKWLITLRGTNYDFTFGSSFFAHYRMFL